MGRLSDSRRNFFLLKSTLQVHPSIHEAGIPMAVWEGMLCRLPIVYSDIPALSETLRDGVHGLSFHPDSPNSMTNSISVLINDQKLAHRIGQRNHDFAKRYSWKYVLPQYFDLYKKLG
jgi:glycosyltransferase involved in cell wall biosynthesis